MVVFKFVSIIFCIFILMFFIMYVLYIIYVICMKVKVICILKLSIGIYIFFYLFKVKRVEVKLFYKFGEFIFEIMFKDVFREIEKILKYFIK